MKVLPEVNVQQGELSFNVSELQLTSEELTRLLSRLQKIGGWRGNPTLKNGVIRVQPASTVIGQVDRLREKVERVIARCSREAELYKLDPRTYITWVKGNRYTVRLLTAFGLGEEDVRELAATLRSNRKVMDVKVVDARVGRDGELTITTHGHQRDEKLMSDLQGTIITVAACRHAV
ncbi:hypothetical protein H6795_04665 [Candidatus Nomurabacteria bacterium]|nr:hypothetical protein [Candidatus Nomurabacteria bacterium]